MDQAAVPIGGVADAEGDPRPITGTVLIVGGDPGDRRSAGRLAEHRAGLAARYAADDRDALDEFGRARPDIVLFDIRSPRPEDFRAVEHLRREHPDVPVVVIAADGGEEMAARAVRVGAVAFVSRRKIERDLAGALTRVLRIAAEDRKRVRVAGCLESRSMRLRLGNDPELIEPLVAMALDDLRLVGFGTPTDRMRAVTALDEALKNALYHGNLELSSDLRQDDERLFYRHADERRRSAPYRDRATRISARVDRAAATFVVRDDGPGFDVARVLRPIDPEDLLRIGGRGLPLIRAFMDDVRFNAAGNQITMVKRPRSPAAAEGRRVAV